MALDQDKVLGRLAEHALIPETRSGKKKRISEIPLPFFFFYFVPFFICTFVPYLYSIFPCTFMGFGFGSSTEVHATSYFL